ncbi:hypothetical protein TIFTF001_042240 [Ficus carica]|uniref:Uncharacterized protein n=1 Tax=Ficus carica TaxID=3494 RepID=A0AA87ZKD1_FICCA|nr:hypothetical protein TIFTF001_042240 [Ficus carica]
MVLLMDSMGSLDQASIKRLEDQKVREVKVSRGIKGSRNQNDHGIKRSRLQEFGYVGSDTS